MLLLTLCCFFVRAEKSNLERAKKKVSEDRESLLFCMSLCICVSCSFVPHRGCLNERCVCFAVGWARLWRLAAYLLSIRSICGCTVCFSVEGCPRRYIQGLLCFKAKYEGDTCAHEGTSRVALHFVQFWSARSQQSVLVCLCGEPCEPQYQINLWGGGNESFLTPGLTPQSAFNFTIFSLVLKPLIHGSMAAEGCSWKQLASVGRLNTRFWIKLQDIKLYHNIISYAILCIFNNSSHMRKIFGRFFFPAPKSSLNSVKQYVTGMSLVWLHLGWIWGIGSLRPSLVKNGKRKKSNKEFLKHVCVVYFCQLFRIKIIPYNAIHSREEIQVWGQQN